MSVVYTSESTKFARPGGRLLGCIGAAALALVLTTGIASAQSPLGFTIDPTLGVPGITVHGQVDVDDVNAFCITDVAEFQARFDELLAGPFGEVEEDSELFLRFFPGHQPGEDIVFETCQQTAFALTALVSLGISANLQGAAEDALPQTFVMTFADLATQQPIGELGHFDPATGVGSTVVPDLPPGLAFVVAACAGPSFDLDVLEAGMRRSGDELEALGMPCDPNDPAFEEFVHEFLNDPEADIFQFLFAIGPQLIQNIVAFDALGLQPFTVTSFDEVLGNLSTHINDLINSGDIRRGHGRGLLNRLKAIGRSLRKNPPRVSTACRQLGNLIRTIEKRVARGHFSSEIGDALIAEVEAAMTAFGCEA